MKDPREQIQTENLTVSILHDESQTIDRQSYWDVIAPSAVPWPEIVAFAQKILAANEAWLDSQTPTLEALRAKYPGAMVEITPLRIPGDNYLARLVTENVSVEYAAPTVGHALEWLAAKLEELTDGK